MSLILLVSLALSVSAATALEFLLQDYDVESTEVLCYGKQLPPGGKLEVSAGSRIIEDAALSTLDREQIPVTVYCLVDSATSLSDRAVQRRTDTLLTLSSQLGKEDNMVIATIDAQMTESKPMDTKDARDTAIKTIAGQSWYTNLYDGISGALKTLQTSTTYHTNRCLVIVSDGHDDGKSVAKSDAVLKQIQETGIPVYSVILTDASITGKETTLHKQFTGESLGGFMAYLDQDKISASAAAQQIWSCTKGAAVIRIGMEELQQSGTDTQLLIRYDTADTRYEDSILVRAVDMPPPTTVPPETTAETAVETTTEETTETTESGGWTTKQKITGGIGAALLAIGVAAYFLLRKKPAYDAEIPVIQPEPESPESDPGTDIFGPGTDIFGPGADIFGPTEPPKSDPKNLGDVTQPVRGRCHVSAVAIMHPEISADFYLIPNMEASFGRTSKSDIVLNAQDGKLSGNHGCFVWNGEMLLVQDSKSTNGTAVNGQNCTEKAWLRLEQGAVLRAGGYDYRITFKVE